MIRSWSTWRDGHQQRAGSSKRRLSVSYVCIHAPTCRFDESSAAVWWARKDEMATVDTRWGLNYARSIAATLGDGRSHRPRHLGPPENTAFGGITPINSYNSNYRINRATLPSFFYSKNIVQLEIPYHIFFWSPAVRVMRSLLYVIRDCSIEWFHVNAHNLAYRHFARRSV